MPSNKYAPGAAAKVAVNKDASHMRINNQLIVGQQRANSQLKTVPKQVIEAPGIGQKNMSNAQFNNYLVQQQQ